MALKIPDYLLKKVMQNTLICTTQESLSNVFKRPRNITAPENVIILDFKAAMYDFIKSRLIAIVRNEKESRTLSTSINKIFKKDLSEDIRSILMNKLQETLDKTSDYTVSFLEIVFLTRLLLKNGGLVFKDNKTSYGYSEKGLDLSKILPTVFVSTT